MTTHGPYAYEPLSSEDRMFLSCERPGIHMHVGATLLFDVADSRTADGSADVARILRYVESRLHCVPRYRQRLRHAAVSGEPVWIDDDRFDAGYHLRHATVPTPGDDVALKRLASQILSRPLDRRRPLWRLWVVTGLKGGHWAIITKIHHCMVDGIAGADLLAALLSPHPAGSEESPPPFAPRQAPNRWRLLAERVTARLRSPLARAAHAPQLLADSSAIASATLAYAQGLVESFVAALHPAPSSFLNQPISPHRRCDWTQVALRDVQAIRDRLGGSVNDVALAVVAGALRRFMLARHPDTSLTDLRILVPVSTRSVDQRHTLGNHVSAWIMTLPLRDADPRRRFEAVCQATAALKASKQHLGGQLLTSAANTLLTAGLRIAEHLRPFNLLVTNVPGPRERLFLLDAPLKYVYPAAPLFPRQGLGIAVFGYADALTFGVQSDCHIVPDTERLIGSIDASFAELAAVAAARATAHPAEHVSAAEQSVPLDGAGPRRRPPLPAHPMPSESRIGATA